MSTSRWSAAEEDRREEAGLLRFLHRFFSRVCEDWIGSSSSLPRAAGDGGGLSGWCARG
jgi:hypothetical protein